jgi:deoxyribonuclease V
MGGTEMLLAFDVHYRPEVAVTACVGFAGWSDPAPVFERVVRSSTPPAAYRPGELYRRELPYILDALPELPAAAEALIIDGHVWLEAGRPGLGAHLHDALGGRFAVVGVAKRPFRRAGGAVPVLRGGSRRPLFVTAVGLDAGRAAELVEKMHGAHRIPTLLARADRLAREREQPDPTRGSWDLVGGSARR